MGRRPARIVVYFEIYLSARDSGLAGNVYLAFAASVTDSLIGAVRGLSSGPLEHLTYGVIFALKNTAT